MSEDGRHHPNAKPSLGRQRIRYEVLSALLEQALDADNLKEWATQRVFDLGAPTVEVSEANWYATERDVDDLLAELTRRRDNLALLLRMRGELD